MKNYFIVEQKPVLSILAAMQPICTKRTTLDATSSILFQVGPRELIIKSTDMEISLQSSYLLKTSDCIEQKTFLVSGRRIFELIKELDGDITCNIEGEQLKLTAGNVDLALNIKDAQDFPPFPERIENMLQLDAKIILELFNKVAFLIPQTNANPALNGLLLEFLDNHMRMTVTDGHSLVQARSELYSLEQNRKWLLPRRAVFELKKLLESAQDATIFLGLCANQLVFSGDSFNFFTKLLADPFPEYTSILEKDGFVPAKVDRSAFVKTLRRSSCFLSGQFIATKFNFLQEQQLRVSMLNKEVGQLQEQVAIQDFVGSDLEIRFYAPYLLSGLQVFPREFITFYLKNGFKPIIFESEEENYKLLYLVMPVAPVNEQ